VGTDRSTSDLLLAFQEAGVLLNAMGDHVFRAVTHMDVTGEDMEKASHIMGRVLASSS